MQSISVQRVIDFLLPTCNNVYVTFMFSFLSTCNIISIPYNFYFYVTVVLFKLS
jgi:hypothetical protein